jgi:hypothetical protein
MKIIKELKYILVILVIILVLMLIRVKQNNFWQGNIRDAAGIISLRENFLTLDELQKMKVKVILIRLDETVIDTVLDNYPTVHIRLEDLGKKEFLKTIRKLNYKMVILSDSQSDAVKAWIILNQAGVKNLFISGGSEMNDESLKYPFQPDPAFRLEPVFKEE